MRHILVPVAAALLSACATAETPPPGPVSPTATAPSSGGGEADALAQIESPGLRNGIAAFNASPHGVMISLHLGSLPPGAHGMHIHAKGDCSDPAFQSAGPHVHSGAAGAHGLYNPAGPEAGDLPNVIIGPDGRAEVQIFTTLVRLSGSTQHPNLLDGDGSAIVIHAGPDDQISQPIGGSGPRIACGVIRRP